MRKIVSICACSIALSLSASAQVTISALSSFGNNGWLAPGTTDPYLTTGSTERGLAYGNGHVYLVSRASVAGSAVNVRILDENTGAELGGLNTTGISGGTYAVNAIGVGADGVIYVGNLTTQSTTSPLKIYSWATEASAPVLSYSGNAGLAGSRVGDDLAVTGAGASTRIVLGYNSNPSVAGNNGYAIIDPAAATATAVGFSGTPPNAGDFRLGLAFTDSTHVIGTAGSSLYRYTSFSGASGTLVSSVGIPDPAGASSDRLLSYTILGGQELLAVQSVGDSHVSIYDASDLSHPLWLASANNTLSPASNANATGNLAWGATTMNADGTVSEILYAMSSNQGIQAFVVTVPEPGSFALFGIGALLLGLRRKFLA